MKFYDDTVTSLVPGPTLVASEVSMEYTRLWGSADLEPEFAQLYRDVGQRLGRLLGGDEMQCVIMSGEAMVVLWCACVLEPVCYWRADRFRKRCRGAVKSLVRAGDRVLCVGGGVFGDGFAGIAEAVGAAVEV
jgi:aspartate aminotransferase-like enzyme